LFPALDVQHHAQLVKTLRSKSFGAPGRAKGVRSMKDDRSLPMIPWFHRDFLSATLGWTVAERGAYFLLLCAQWEMGPLSNDHARLAAILGVPVEEFKSLWTIIHPKFLETENGLVNHRLEEHRQEAIRRRDNNHRRAKRGAAARWEKASARGNREPAQYNPASSDAPSGAQSMPKALPSGCPPSPSPSPSMNSGLAKGEMLSRPMKRVSTTENITRRGQNPERKKP
jgi:uncharacterized protein YdaU (DUF1376 family)